MLLLSLYRRTLEKEEIDEKRDVETVSLMKATPSPRRQRAQTDLKAEIDAG